MFVFSASRHFVYFPHVLLRALISLSLDPKFAHNPKPVVFFHLPTSLSPRTNFLRSFLQCLPMSSSKDSKTETQTPNTDAFLHAMRDLVPLWNPPPTLDDMTSALKTNKWVPVTTDEINKVIREGGGESAASGGSGASGGSAAKMNGILADTYREWYKYHALRGPSFGPLEWNQADSCPWFEHELVPFENPKLNLTEGTPVSFYYNINGYEFTAIGVIENPDANWKRIARDGRVPSGRRGGRRLGGRGGGDKPRAWTYTVGSITIIDLQYSPDVTVSFNALELYKPIPTEVIEKYWSTITVSAKTAFTVTKNGSGEKKDPEATPTKQPEAIEVKTVDVKVTTAAPFQEVASALSEFRDDFGDFGATEIARAHELFQRAQPKDLGQAAP